MADDGGKISRVAVAQKQRHTSGRQELNDLMQHGLSHRQGSVTLLNAQQ
jgi:hypothetical protein